MIAMLDDRAVLRVHGAEAAEFLNGLVTSDVMAVTSDTPVWAALLTAQGKYIADMFVFAGSENEYLLDVAAARAEPLMQALARYRLRRKIDIAPVRLHVFAAWGPKVDKRMSHPADPRLAGLGLRWLSASEVVDAETADWHAHRIALGVPGSGDFEPGKLMWLESNADHLHGVSFAKGCFVGQENTARMNYRGKIRKRILPIHLAGDPGEAREIMVSGKPVGTLTSLTQTPDGWRGLAHLRLEHASAPLAIGDVGAVVNWPSWLPRGDEGKEAPPPGQPAEESAQRAETAA